MFDLRRIPQPFMVAERAHHAPTDPKKSTMNFTPLTQAHEAVPHARRRLVLIVMRSHHLAQVIAIRLGCACSTFGSSTVNTPSLSEALIFA